MIREQIRPTIFLFAALTVITGALYPLAVTGIADGFFKRQAEGSLIFRNGQPVGSELIGQPFHDPAYFWGRPSGTSPAPFNASSSSGTNYGPMNPDYLKAVEGRVKTLRDADPAKQAAVPVDLVTTSASGLDPHISLAGAAYQVPRIARARGVSEEEVKIIIQKNSERRFLHLLGEPVVNVLKANLDLDRLKKVR